MAPYDIIRGRAGSAAQRAHQPATSPSVDDDVQAPATAPDADSFSPEFIHTLRASVSAYGGPEKLHLWRVVDDADLDALLQDR